MTSWLKREKGICNVYIVGTHWNEHIILGWIGTSIYSIEKCDISPFWQKKNSETIFTGTKKEQRNYSNKIAFPSNYPETIGFCDTFVKTSNLQMIDCTKIET